MMEKQRKSRRSAAVTMLDIAKQCGVSKQTVSKAFLGDPEISQATTKRVIETAAQMGYDPEHHHAARRMALSKSGQRVLNQAVALFFPPYTFRSKYLDDLFWGIMQGTTDAGFALMVTNECDPRTIESVPLPPIFRRGDIDGAIVQASPETFLPTLQQLREEKNFGSRPIVSLLHLLPDCSSVVNDDYQGAYAAISHLFELGHRRIAHFFKPDEILYMRSQRLSAYRQACSDFGIDVDECLQYIPWKYRDTQQALDTLSQALQADPEITAILAPSDNIATMIRQHLAQHDLRVPDDISLIGCDDTEIIPDERGQNILTTVHLPLYEAGRQAAALLVQKIINRDSKIEQITLPTEFIVRGSTAPPRTMVRQAAR